MIPQRTQKTKKNKKKLTQNLTISFEIIIETYHSQFWLCFQWKTFSLYRCHMLYLLYPFHFCKPMFTVRSPCFYWNLDHFTSISPGLNNVNSRYTRARTLDSTPDETERQISLQNEINMCFLRLFSRFYKQWKVSIQAEINSLPIQILI